MIGKILGFDGKTGTISGDNGLRYTFSKEDFKESSLPQKDMKVDFAVDENENIAKDIYVTKDQVAENTSTMLGLLAVGITFFLGFIGTFISRVFLAKQSVGNVIVPTIIHLLITLLMLIPVLGWLIYLAGTFYYMYKNYQLTVSASK
ncbi:hypothetical protein JHD46_08150 [Sulfurimonas sp. SAG-AH-194-C20]|nr:hypothetical protein [Sulfurimonas sp. SAG-AH-194-C20]MDF1879606.1 hypothetical protein [Sulfurimonas sp. SAG-AH-194-C20]